MKYILMFILKSYLFTSLYVKELGNSDIGNMAYGLAFRFGSDVHPLKKLEE